MPQTPQKQSFLGDSQNFGTLETIYFKFRSTHVLFLLFSSLTCGIITQDLADQKITPHPPSACNSTTASQHPVTAKFKQHLNTTFTQLRDQITSGYPGQLYWVGCGGGKEVITALVEPYTAHYTQMIDYSAYLINIVRLVSCFPRAGWLLPLGFQLGCFAGFRPTTWLRIFSAFFFRLKCGHSAS